MSFTVTNLTNEYQSFGNLNLEPGQVKTVPYVDQAATAAAVAAGRISISPSIAAATTLTNNSGGTVSTTLALIPDTVTGVDGVGDTAASKADVDAALVIIRNAIASLAAASNNNLAGINNALAQFNNGIENP